MDIKALICSIMLLVYSGIGQAEINVYFGNLHAHSNLSDGAKNISAEKAFTHAKNNGLDFMSLSEHNHMLTRAEMNTLQQAALQETTNDFVALFGQEYSFIKSGNHTNIHNYPFVIPKSLNGQYKKIFGTILPTYSINNPDTIIIAGFNHPKKLKNDYGLQKDYNGNFDAFVEDLDPYVQLIAIGSGPADANKKDFTVNSTTDLIHRDVSKSRWFSYLSHGMHLAPKVDHDNHSLTYGQRVSGRTAVWIDGAITKEKLLLALSNRHVYATEDYNLVIKPTLSTGHLPGDIIEQADITPITLTLTVEDSDEPNATYRLEIYVGEANTERPVRIVKKPFSNGVATVEIEGGEAETYFIAHIIQTSDDPENDSTKADAWLAPIWIRRALESDDDFTITAKFVGSKNSKVYHLPDCSVVNQIAEHNLVYYDSEPIGLRLHKNCPFQNE